MIEVSNSVAVDTTREAAWDLISDFEGVWEPSNPAHRGTKVLNEPKQPIRDGLRFWQREKVGPLTGEFVATVHDTNPGHAFSWSATATYRLFGFPIKVNEGGTFEIIETESGVSLRHYLWGELPNRLLEWFARVVLREEKAMTDHNSTELHYFKSKLEVPQDGTR